MNRLVEVLNRLREENTGLKGRIQELEQQNQQSQEEIGRLRPLEGELSAANQTREEVKGRVEGLLQRLDGLEL